MTSPWQELSIAAIILGMAALACWIAYLRGVYHGSQQCDEFFQSGLRAGRAAGESAGIIAGLNTASVRMLEFGRNCLIVLGVEAEVQDAVLRVVARTMEEEAQVGTAEELEQAYGGDFKRDNKQGKGER